MPQTPYLAPGPLMIDVDGLTLTAEDRELISHPLTGGIILFARNYHDPEQLSELTRQIRAARPGSLLIAVDQEGGRVQRFKDGFTRIPPMRAFGEIYDSNPARALAELTDTATLLAWELRQHDVDFSFAPVADIDHGRCPAIGDRALHNTVNGAVELARAVIDGFAVAGCAGVIKHFPGHGGVDVDPHTDFARDDRTADDILRGDMQVFVVLHTRATAVMLAHVIYENIDDSPATLSAVWQQQVLRREVGFDGPILTDDLSMGAITGRMSQADAAAIALAAGSDLALICNDREAVIAACEHPQITVGGRRQAARRNLLRARAVDAPGQQVLARAAETVATYG